MDLASLRQRKALKLDKMESILVAAKAEDRDLTEVELGAYNELKAEVESYIKQITLAEDIAKLKATNLVPARGENTDLLDSENPSRRVEPQVKSVEDKGLGFARIVRCLAIAKGVVGEAARIADKHFGDGGVAKALAAGDASAGGFLVPTNYSTDVIELLRSRAVVRRAGAIVMPMQGSTDIPAMASGSSAGYVGENSNISTTEPTFRNLKATERTLAAIIPISNSLLRLSSPSADAMVRNDIVASLAVTEDAAFIRSQGLGVAPRGLRYWASSGNVAATAGTSAANIETDMKALIQGLEGNNCRMLNVHWLMAPRSKNHLWTLRDSNGNLVFPEIRDGKLWDYPVEVTNNIPTNLGGGTETEIYLADMADVVIAENPQLEIMASAEAAYDSNGTVVAAFSLDQTVIRVIMRHDLIVRHAESIAVRTGVTWGA